MIEGVSTGDEAVETLAAGSEMVDGRGDDGRRRRSPASAGRLGIAVGMLAVVGLGGCAHDCDQSYCDMVRAGASGWFAHELVCCRDPDAPDCDAREARMHEFNLLAARMRSACEAQNWDLFRDLWNDGWRLLPGFMPFLVADEFCDGWDWSGVNAWVPFAPHDSVAASLVLDPEPPRLDLGRASVSGGPEGAIVAPTIAHEWTIRPGSMVAVEAFGTTLGFAASGSLSVVEQVVDLDILPGDDAESWCRRMEPRAFAVDLRTSDGLVAMRLDPDFEGSMVRFDGPDHGVIGLGVSVDASMTWSDAAPFEVSLESAFLEIPFTIASDRMLTLLPGASVPMLDVLPVDPVVEAWIRGEDPSGVAAGDEACVDRARAVAEAYLALHADCDPDSN